MPVGNRSPSPKVVGDSLRWHTGRASTPSFRRRPESRGSGGIPFVYGQVSTGAGPLPLGFPRFTNEVQH